MSKQLSSLSAHSIDELKNFTFKSIYRYHKVKDDDEEEKVRPPKEGDKVLPDHEIVIRGYEIPHGQYGFCQKCIENPDCPIKFWKILRTWSQAFMLLKIFSVAVTIVSLLYLALITSLRESIDLFGSGESIERLANWAPAWAYLVRPFNYSLMTILNKLIIGKQINDLPRGKLTFADLDRCLTKLSFINFFQLLVISVVSILDYVYLANHPSPSFLVWYAIDLLLLCTYYFCAGRALWAFITSKRFYLSSSQNRDHGLRPAASRDNDNTFLKIDQDNKISSSKDTEQFPCTPPAKKEAFNLDTKENSIDFNFCSTDKSSVGLPQSPSEYYTLKTKNKYPPSTDCKCACCFPDADGKLTVKHVKNKTYYDTGFKLIECLTFSYLTPIVLKAYRRTIESADLNILPRIMTAEVQSKRFEKCWSAEYSKKGEKSSLIRALFQHIKYRLLIGALLKLLHDCCYLSQPLLLRYFINRLTGLSAVMNQNVPNGESIGTLVYTGVGTLAFVMLLSIIQLLALNAYFQTQTLTGIMLRIALGNAVHIKALKYAYGHDINLQSSQKSQGKVRKLKCWKKTSENLKEKTSKQEEKLSSHSGEIVNLMSVDADRLVDAMPMLHLLWSSPFQIIVTMVILWFQLGPSMLAGLGVMVIVFILATYGMTKIKSYNAKISKLRDQRVETIQEVLGGIKIVKTSAWENPFTEKITDLRQIELNLLWLNEIFQGIQRTLWTILPFVVTLASFSIYVANNNEVKPETIYPAISAFMLLTFPLIALPMCITLCIQALISCNRLKNFLVGPEVPPQQPPPVKPMIARDEATLIADHLTLSWWNQSPLLDDVSFKCYPGTVTMIVGKTGVGKTGLIHALVGNLRPEAQTFDGKHSSNLIYKGRLAYVAQTAWIQSTTLRLNILFGRPYIHSWYQKVLYACALSPDLEVLPEGDATEIGERGVTLSGGQKQRIALARAVYQCGPFTAKSPEGLPADIYVFDDILSAVDVHVANHIFKNCIQGILCKSHRTVVMTTHKFDILPHAQQIVFLGRKTLPSNQIDSGDSKVQIDQVDKTTEAESFTNLPNNNTQKSLVVAFAIGIGSYEDLKDNVIEALAATQDGESKHNDERTGLPEQSEIVTSESSMLEATDSFWNSPSIPNADFNILKRGSEISVASRQRGCSQISSFDAQDAFARKSSGQLSGSRLKGRQSDSLSKIVQSKHDKNDSRQNQLQKDEVIETGRIRLEVYYGYLKGLGGLHVLFFLALVYVFGQACHLGSNYWMAYWLDNYKSFHPIRQGILYYSLLGILQMLSFIVASLYLFRCSLRASRYLHSRLLRRVFRAPMSFFDTIPLGRLISRFSKDFFYIDTLLPVTLCSCISTLLIVIETFVALCVAVPPFLAVATPILVIYIFIQGYFFASRRQLQRILSTSRSPLYVHFMETLDGYSTIRAFRAQARFIRVFESKLEVEGEANFNSLTLNRWLAVRLDFLGAIIVFTTGLFVFLGVIMNQITAALGGFALTYALNITGAMNWMVRMAGDFQSQVVAVERVEQSSVETPVEAPLQVKQSSQSLKNWPSEGKIVFKNISLRYRPELPYIIQNFNLTLQSATKVGIIGRTGAGKSSIFSCLFRLVEPDQGAIFIDGVNILKIGLKDLRSRIAIIPQDPVLFAGTLRFNLDPFNSYTDKQLWQAIKRTHLFEFVKNDLKGNFSHHILEGGANISLGQRQLLCFSRAILREPKILLLDEATSAIDPRTDQLIQKTIREEFKQCTIITIAHRIATVLDYDEIVVMDSGSIAEQGSPAVLFSAPNGAFRKMCLESDLRPIVDGNS